MKPLAKICVALIVTCLFFGGGINFAHADGAPSAPEVKVARVGDVELHLARL